MIFSCTKTVHFQKIIQFTRIGVYQSINGCALSHLGVRTDTKRDLFDSSAFSLRIDQRTLSASDMFFKAIRFSSTVEPISNE